MAQDDPQGAPGHLAWAFCVAGAPLKEPFHFTVLPVASEPHAGLHAGALPAEACSVFHGSVSVSIAGRSRVGAARLLAELEDRLLLLLRSRGSSLLAFMAHRQPGAPGAHLRTGYLVSCDEHVDTLIKEMSADSDAEWQVCRYEALADGCVRQTVQRGGGGGGLTGGTVVPAEAPPLHPAFLSGDTYPVFHRYEEARAVMEECVEFLPEAAELLKLSEEWRKVSADRGSGMAASASSSLHPIVVLEGLDATGKSTVTRGLQRSLGATLLPLPADHLDSYLPLFVNQPNFIRRAYYCLRNYILDGQASQAARKGPVVLDRFWHSTAAYAVATEDSGGGGVPVGALPPEGHPVYRWPWDLLAPSVAVMLTLSPAERQRRLLGRGEDITREERRLQEDAAFRERVEEAYRRMREPRCIPIDASDTPAGVLQKVMDIILQHHEHLKPC
uniref:UMP-CMP kinase 2, mitochondrial n=1 Tax=Petromyzon marinus TaxID=7757 RepID=A0AAJ7TDY9_PETMA|nr:UMP-CMP kinase 2, mitochondrial [Petromyzon marinus]